MNTHDTNPLTQEKPLLILMDGHAMVYRAFYAIQQPMNISGTGEDVRGVFGFLNSFLRTLTELRPTHSAITFDLSKPTFRHHEYSEYKAQRPPSPPELKAQFPHVRRAMTALGVPIFEQEGYEADDVIGTLCWQAEQQNIDTIILTSDTDELQLVSPFVRVLLTYGIQKKTLYDISKVRERYGGLGPEAVPDIKALQGDPSDNIPGIPGVGSKTAIRLLNQFKSVEGILDNLDEIDSTKTRQSIEDNKERALHGKFLTTIVRNVPVKLDLEQARLWKYDRAEVISMLRDLGFVSMVDRIPDPRVDVSASTQPELPINTVTRETHYTIVDTIEKLNEMVHRLDSPEGFSFDTETTGKNPVAANLVGLSFSNTVNLAWYVPVGHDEGTQLPLDQVLNTLRPLFESTSIPKVAHNACYDLTVLARQGVTVRNLALDTMVAAHLVGRKALGLKALSLELLNIEMTSITDLIGTGKKQITMAQTSIEQAAEYAAADADITEQLRGVLEQEMEEKAVKSALNTVEIPLSSVLMRMQLNGVAMDSDLLKTMSIELGNQMSAIEANTHEIVGHKFNLNSSQQLGEVLFNELSLPPTKRTQKGYSTDASSLESLKVMLDLDKVQNVDPKASRILNNILEYRQISKIKSTYTDSLPHLVNPETGRIHTSYNQAGAATGRVSSNDPNVQNIPVRTELGRKVRKAFVAEKAPDWTLLAADYSQIELRVLAHLSQDAGLLRAFKSGQDIHAATASSVYGVPVDVVVPDMRRIAKIMNFGVIYGLSPHGISQQTGLSAKEGKMFIEAYFGQYPGISEYIDSVKSQVKNSGYVETLIGRRRYVPEAKSSNFHVRGAGERMAINMPIQGTAADILKIAMVRIQERMDAESLRSMMIIQVHDELIFEVPRDELDVMKSILLEMMPSAMNLVVPLDIEIKTGDTWGDME